MWVASRFKGEFRTSNSFGWLINLFNPYTILIRVIIKKREICSSAIINNMFCKYSGKIRCFLNKTVKTEIPPINLNILIKILL